MPRIHPTAIVHGEAQLADDVEIGPFCVIERDVTLGAGTVVRSHSIIRRYTTLGEGNLVDSFCSLGGWPQDLKFTPDTKSFLRVGDQNVFRENVTISRATTPGGATRVGNQTYWMAGSHAGHDATVEDEVVLASGVMLAGHCTVKRAAVLAGGSCVHQFTWVGERVMLQGLSGAAMHTPPYTIATDISRIAGLNMVGLRRAPDVSDEDRAQVKDAFRIFYRKGLSAGDALAEMDAHEEWGSAASRFRAFIHDALDAEKPFNRGLAGLRR
jgi:UDP-N-acetylglucosamine acyltransferase